jgi:hypothetical protein
VLKLTKFILVIIGIAVLFMLAVFLFVNPNITRTAGIGQDAIDAAPPHLSAQGLSSTKDLPIPISIPDGAGHIVEGYTAPGAAGRVIIHIQDIHTNYEAQKNLSKMLESLIKENGLKLIMVEGGWGNVSLSYLRSYATPDRRHEVAEEYLEDGKISGEEYLDIISDYDIQLEGIEDEALYKANLDVFFEIEQFRNQAAEDLGPLLDVITQLKKKIYSPQLIELEKAKREYDNEQIALADYYAYLDMMAAKTMQGRVGYPNFDRFMGIVKSEREIQFPAVEKERAALIERLSKKLSKQDLTALVTKSLEFRLNKMTPLQYHDYLVETARKAGEHVEQYKNLGKYIEYIRAHETIDTAVLFEEADSLLRSIEEVLIKNQHQRKLYSISRSAQILNNFLDLKLVPNDFLYYKQNRNVFLTAGWIDFLRQQAEHNKMRATNINPAPNLDRNLSTLVRFYDLANERDDAFVQNAIRLMGQDDAAIAVLIAGGFHTPNLKQKLKECGISYIVVAPHTTQQTDPEQYRYILKYKSGREQ